MSLQTNKKFIETDNIEDILEHLSPDAAIFFDLDNTLIESCQHFGTVQWFEHYEKKLLEGGRSPMEAEQEMQSLWNQKLLPGMVVRLLDNSTPDLFLELQQRGHRVLGLTARYPADASYTHSQLGRLGIQFCQQHDNFEIPFEFPVLFDKGIIYASMLNPKSTALLAVLKQIDYYPSSIIFIDDKMAHVHDVEQSVSALDINYVGVRYSKADKRVQEFDPHIAKIQMDAFPEFISDEEALKMMINYRLNEPN